VTAAPPGCATMAYWHPPSRDRFTASEEDAANAVLALAAGRLDEIAYTDFLRANLEGLASANRRDTAK
jgi:hypothetical protein